MHTNLNLAIILKEFANVIGDWFKLIGHDGLEFLFQRSRKRPSLVDVPRSVTMGTWSVIHDKFNRNKENIASLATQIQALTVCVREGVCVRGTPLFFPNLPSFWGLVVQIWLKTDIKRPRENCLRFQITGEFVTVGRQSDRMNAAFCIVWATQSTPCCNDEVRENFTFLMVKNNTPGNHDRRF